MMRIGAVLLAASAAYFVVMAVRERRPKQSQRPPRSGAAVLLAALGFLRRLMPWLVGIFSRNDARLAIQRAGLDGQRRDPRKSRVT